MWLRNPICNEKSSVRIVRDSLSLSPSLYLSLFLGWLRIYITAYFQAYLWHALTSERAKIMQYNYGKARIWPLSPLPLPLPHPTYLCHCSVLFVRVVKNVTCLLRLSCALRLSKFRLTNVTLTCSLAKGFCVPSYIHSFPSFRLEFQH